MAKNSSSLRLIIIKIYWISVNSNVFKIIPSLSCRPVHDDKFDVDVLPVLVKEVRHEIGHGLVRDVTAQNDVSART